MGKTIDSSQRLTFVFDLDGVIYRGMEPMPLAIETVLTLKERGHIIRYLTNNSASSRKSYSVKLAELGLETPEEHIMTSAYATAFYLLEQGAQGKTAFRIGGLGIKEELELIGMKVLAEDEEPDAHIDYVVVGLDREFTYCKLARAQAAILGGAKFIATNTDPSFPLEEKTLAPGGGCMVAAVQTATGVEPHVVGKPMTYSLDKILELTNTPPERAIMVGDRLDTDIEVGRRAGTQTVLVLTGVTGREQAFAAEGKYKPDRIVETLWELT